MSNSLAAYTQVQSEALMDDVQINPVTNEQRGECHITLTFDGVALNPGAIYDALKALGVVRCNLVPASGKYNFLITVA